MFDIIDTFDVLLNVMAMYWKIGFSVKMIDDIYN